MTKEEIIKYLKERLEIVEKRLSTGSMSDMAYSCGLLQGTITCLIETLEKGEK